MYLSNSRYKYTVRSESNICSLKLMHINMAFNPAIMATRSSALELAQTSGVLPGKHMSGDSWIRNLPCISDLQREACGKLFFFKQKHLSFKGIDFFDMKNSLPSLATSAWNSVRASHSQLFCSRRGIILFYKEIIKVMSPLLASICLV